MDLTNKVIAVTGGAQGLGFAMAKGIAERGARLALIDMNAEPLEQAAASLRELGAEVSTFVANVADEGSVIAAFDGIIDQFGTLQGLINNAGISMRGIFVDTDLSVLKRLMDTNFWGTVYCSKYALPQLLQNKGSVIGISSIAGFKGLPARTGYSASKFAVVGMTKSAAMEYATKNIRINAVCPGYTESALLDQLINAKPEMDAILKSVIPMKRYGKASEIADAIVWLASDQTKFMTGQTITLDGGTSL